MCSVKPSHYGMKEGKEKGGKRGVRNERGKCEEKRGKVLIKGTKMGGRSGDNRMAKEEVKGRKEGKERRPHLKKKKKRKDETKRNRNNSA